MAANSTNITCYGYASERLLATAKTAPRHIAYIGHLALESLSAHHPANILQL